MIPEVKQFLEQYHEYCERIAQGRHFYAALDKESARMTGDDAFIDFANGKYQYGYYQRGICSIEFESEEKDKVMYFPIYNATRSLAYDYEYANRARYADFQKEAREARIVAFKTWIQYMKSINTEWAKKLEIELTVIAQCDDFSIAE